jgi:glycosyltransferase involved in cell wall biosynthesis
MNIPKISIVTPSYNQAEFLEETIQSVLQQDYANLEYVIIDGGSSDSSVDIIKKYENKLHYWISEKDAGHGHALNKGFSHTSGEIMAWLNSDDKYTPWSLKTIAEIFNLFPHIDWIIGFCSWWNQNGAMTHAGRVPKNIYDFLLGNYCWIQQESVFWRRRLWDKAGGYIDQNYKFMVDGELWTRFFLHAELYSVDCVLGGFRFHQDNRGILNEQLCRQEMEMAISNMKSKCSSKIISINKRLRWLKTANKFLFCNSKLFSELVSVILKEVKYKNIRFRDREWGERSLPFYLNN